MEIGRGRQPRRRPERLLARIKYLGGTELERQLRAAEHTLSDGKKALDRMEALYVKVIQKREDEIEALQIKIREARRLVDKLRIKIELEQENGT